MTREELYKLIENGPVYLDGATGSNLMKAGMPVGVCPEEWITCHSESSETLYRSRNADFVCADFFRKQNQTDGVWTGRPYGRNQYHTGSSVPESSR